MLIVDAQVHIWSSGKPTNPNHRQVPVFSKDDALVKKHPHDALAIIRAVASSRKATTCSRLTVGNPARKSSIVSPPSR